MQHRRTDRRRFLPIGAALAAAVCAVTGAVVIVIGEFGGSPDGSDRADTLPPPAGIACAKEGKVPGSGSTAQQNAMERWIQEYERACPPVRIAYNPLGSGAGVAQFMRQATSFGGTDGALKPEDIELSRRVCRGGKAIDLPMVGGPIAIGYNLQGVDDLVLDAGTLAKIFDSAITKWSDPAIRELNPGIKLPDLAIQAVHRSDNSGTTQNLNAYLNGAAPDQWPYAKEKTWQGKGGHSAAGSDGVAGAVRNTEGTIGYFELSFASKLKIPTVRIDTGAAKPVEATPETASAGIASAKLVGKGDDVTLEFDYATQAEGAYPIVLVTYEIVCDTGNQPEMLPALKSFLAYTASEEGQKILPSIHYAPPPENVATRVRKVIATLS
ncbi:phosphate ABC transporter substrate-binding protein PstS [Streptomyces sp. NBC_01619]|uniref:phosphate ABC transporter substrate-binding protein PstS n=1 Tax=Streptomyces sp. NBC_01619 TaxID=2975901 RepID=UPI00225A80D0|nr:phosphate ABC transporter substrate-binding protein PstS [Streptomyces sp. NBC_01619]MCX4510695.1 phosphate ABC transporter substrate-binding protein PstS [Streptomyces sp. NBC_01619]